MTFAGLKTGDKVLGPQGQWKEKPGTQLATLERERNPKPICTPEKGEISELHSELEGCFVEAGTPLAVLRHMLTREEVQRAILQKALHLHYTGPDGVIYAVYFKYSENMDTGAPLIGVCPQDQLPAIQDVIMRVQTEWTEKE